MNLFDRKIQNNILEEDMEYEFICKKFMKEFREKELADY